MEIIRDAASCPAPANGTVVTIGAYDGVHRGHQAVIATVQQLAETRDLRTAVVTFDRHPAAVVRPESAPPLLTDLDQKLELLEGTGVDYVYVIHFDEVRSKEPAEDFVTEVLIDCLNAKVVVVGEDFHFGHQRRGNVALLESMGTGAGFEVVGIELVDVDGTTATADEDRVSSTAIRVALRDGRLDAANTMLGRPYEVRGVVIDGDKRGARPRFPHGQPARTRRHLRPGRRHLRRLVRAPDGVPKPAAISLGRRPTFYDDADRSVLEAHVLDFDGDLYGEVARVLFVARLRDELKFDSVDALVAQMSVDVEETRRLLTRSAT